MGHEGESTTCHPTEKVQPVIQLIDKIRKMIMEKFDIRKGLANKLNDKILPQRTKDLNARRKKNLREHK